MSPDRDIDKEPAEGSRRTVDDAERQAKTDQQSKNEGEGNRTADRKYREGVRRHLESGASGPAAEEAQQALESTEADELRKAEDAAKSGHKRQ
jgi:hypothetical protein